MLPKAHSRKMMLRQSTARIVSQHDLPQLCLMNDTPGAIARADTIGLEAT
jgi:hypothetical protein